MIPNTTHTREVEQALTSAGYALASEDRCDWATVKRTFVQTWTKDDADDVTVYYSRDGYATGYSSRSGYADTHAEGRSGRGRSRGPWRASFTPRNLVDLLVREVQEGRV